MSVSTIPSKLKNARSTTRCLHLLGLALKHGLQHNRCHEVSQLKLATSQSLPPTRPHPTSPVHFYKQVTRSQSLLDVLASSFHENDVCIEEYKPTAILLGRRVITTCSSDAPLMTW